jgi:hypothetical protein
VVDAAGRPIAGAQVTGVWSGEAKGRAKAQTDQRGVATTPNTKIRKRGSVSFTVTEVVPPVGNYVWDGTSTKGTATL